MTSLSRSASLLVARASLALVVLSFAVYGTWSAGFLFGQQAAQKKQRIEEEEEAPKVKKPKRKVIRVEDEEPAKAPSKEQTDRPAGPAASGDLAQLAEQASHPAIKALFRSLAVPHDLVSYKRSGVTINGEKKSDERIEPIPFYLGDDPGRYRRERLLFTRFTLDWQREKPYSPLIENLQSVIPYERIAQEKVSQFLRESHDQRERSDPLYLSRYDMLIAAEQALSSVLRWHESAIQTGKRRGEGWDKVGKSLRTQLLDEVLLEQMKERARVKDWNRVLDLTHRLAKTYGNDTQRERILQPVVDMIYSALNDPTATEESRNDVRKRLHELEMEFPDNPALQRLSEPRRKVAQSLLEQAQELVKSKKDKRAREVLDQAEQTWPHLPGLRELKTQLNFEYPILRVGVRGPLPKYFSPAWACTDNEHRIVEMLFESLVELVPDEAGGFRYRPELAESSPKVVQLGRFFQLPRNAFWSNRKRLNATDVDLTVEMLRGDGAGVGRSRVWGDLLHGVESIKDPFQVTLRLRQGFVAPLAPMTFKILPRNQENPPVTSEEFALRPVTSGPFRLDPSRRSDESRRECLFFVANPDYGLRPNKRGAPHIQEIRFYSFSSNTNIAAELASGKLDMVLDLTAKEADELLKNPKADIVIPMPSPNVPNRRIYFLAINTSKLATADLRQALSCAIDREAVLKKCFRAELKAPLHKALNGPFPLGSWACKESPALYNQDRAKLLREQPAVRQVAKEGPLVLKYPTDDPALDVAMKELCAQVKELTGVVIEPRPCDPSRLREDVEQTGNYDMAYYHYDFPDESYWLYPLFGPPPGKDESNINIFKFQNTGLTTLLDETKSFRSFATFQKHQWLIFDLLNRELPFIPLWQLDPLLAYRRDVQPETLDPQLPFRNIEEWHLLRK